MTRTAVRNDNALVQEEGWARVSAHEVSDDEEVDPDPNLIVPGDESSHGDRAESFHLSASGIDLSQVDLLRITSILADDNDREMEEEGEEDELLGSSDDVEVYKVDSSSLSAHSGLTARMMKTLKTKKIIALVASAWLLVVCIALIQAWQRRSQKIAFLEQRLQEFERKEQEAKEKKTCGWKEDEGRELADNCYLHAGLGDCSKHMVADWNDKLTIIYNSFENIASWTWEDEEAEENDSELHKMSSFGVEALSELSYSVASTLAAAGEMFHSFWHEIGDATEESLEFVANEFSIQRVGELTRDALDDATSYTRPKK